MPGWLKRVIIAGARRLSPRVIRSLPESGLRARLLTTLGQILRTRPVRFRRAKTPFGFAIAGATTDLLQRRVYVFGFWEPNISRWASRHLRPSDVVIDIGANVGYFSLLSAACVGPGGRVIAFEPVPSIVAALRGNLAINDVESVTVVPAIAADEEGAAEIFRGEPGNLGLSTTSPHEGFTSEGSVRKVRAADAIEPELWARVRLVKVDTEGDEVRALRGLEPVLRAMPAGAGALVEVNPEDLAERGQSAAELVGFMRESGFDEMLEIANSYEEAAYAHDKPQDPVPLTDVPSAKADVIFIKPAGATGR